MPKRKPPEKVRAISGDFRPDIVTKAEMQEASDLQATAWMAEKNAREFVQRLEHRIQSGAQIEDCEFTFDMEMQMVRTKKAG